MTKKKRKQILQRSGLHIFYIILCLLALVPILYALNLSFERGSGALSSGLSLFPKEVEHCPLDYLCFQRNLHWIIIKIY